MLKQEFLGKLRSRLSGLPETEMEERLNFYSEMIDDRMEDGLSEEEAVAAIGTVEEIVVQIVAETPFTMLAKERIKPKRQLKTWEIVLLVLGSPVWLSLGIAAIAVILSVYAAFGAVILSLWAVFAAMVGAGIGGMISGIGMMIGDSSLAGIALMGASIVCAGLSIFVFYGCKAAAKGTVTLTKKIALGIKKCLAGKEDAV